MQRVLAEQVEEQRRKKQLEQQRRKDEDERELERIRRDQDEEKRRIQAEKEREANKKQALNRDNKAAVVTAIQDYASPRPAGPRGRTAGTAQEPPAFALAFAGAGDSFGAAAQPPPAAFQAGGSREDLFGAPAPHHSLPPVAGGDLASHGAPPGPAPWEAAAPAASAPWPGRGGLQSPPDPNSHEMLQGFLQQHQELYRQQQAQLARLQEEAHRLREEKDAAKQDLLDLKSRQVDEKEKEVKKLQRKLHRKMLLHGGGAGLDFAASELSTPTASPSGSGPGAGASAAGGGRAAGKHNGFWSKYEVSGAAAAPVPPLPVPSGERDWDGRPLHHCPGPADMLRHSGGFTRAGADTRSAAAIEASLEDGWSLAQAPWLEPGAADGHHGGTGTSVSEARKERDGFGDSLFDDSWRPVRDDEEFLQSQDDPAAASCSLPADRQVLPRGAGASFSGTALLGDTLDTDSKLVRADACDFGTATWRPHSSTWRGGAATAGLGSLPTVAETAARCPDDAAAGCALDASSGAQFGFLPGETTSSLGAPANPLAALEEVVRAIREARGEADGRLSEPASSANGWRLEGSELSSEPWERSLLGSGAGGEPPGTAGDGGGSPWDRSLLGGPGAVDMATPLSRLDDSSAASGYGRSRAASAALGASLGAPLDAVPSPMGRRSAGLTARGGGGLLGCGEADVLTLSGPCSRQELDSVGICAAAAPAPPPPAPLGADASGTSTPGRRGLLSSIGTSRPLEEDDFAAVAAAEPEDFEAFLARLRAGCADDAGAWTSAGATLHGGFGSSQRPDASASGVHGTSSRPGSGGLAADPLAAVPGSHRERVRTGSPVLRSAAAAVLGGSASGGSRPSSGGRPLSGNRPLSSGRPPSGGKPLAAGPLDMAGSRPPCVLASTNGAAAGYPRPTSSAVVAGTGPSLKELRRQRSKPRTVEDLALDVPADGSRLGGGPGISLHSTVGASGSRPGSNECSALEALRSERRSASRGRGSFGS